MVPSYVDFLQLFEAKIEAFGQQKMSNQLDILQEKNRNIKVTRSYVFRTILCRVLGDKKGERY